MLRMSVLHSDPLFKSYVNNEGVFVATTEFKNDNRRNKR